MVNGCEGRAGQVRDCSDLPATPHTRILGLRHQAVPLVTCLLLLSSVVSLKLTAPVTDSERQSKARRSFRVRLSASNFNIFCLLSSEQLFFEILLKNYFIFKASLSRFDYSLDSDVRHRGSFILSSTRKSCDSAQSK